MAKTGITINLDELRDLMREFMAEMDDEGSYAWPFETFLQWAKKRKEQQWPLRLIGKDNSGRWQSYKVRPKTTKETNQCHD